MRTFFFVGFFTGLSSSGCSEESDNCKLSDWFGDFSILDLLFAFSALPGVSDLNLFIAGVDFTTGDCIFPAGVEGEDRGEDSGLRVTEDILESLKDDFRDIRESFGDPLTGVRTH